MSHPNNNYEFYQEMMLKFLNTNCAIKRRRNERKKFVNCLVIDEGFTGHQTKMYPIGGVVDTEIIAGDIYTILKNVFEFSEDEMIDAVWEYLKDY